MSRLNTREATTTTVESVDNLKKVQTRLKTLILTLQNVTDHDHLSHEDNNKQSKTTAKRESLFRELNQMRNDVIVYVNDIQKQILSLRPTNTNDDEFQNKAHTYITLVQLTTDLLTKINQLFTKIFDEMTQYINDLWVHMNNHDQTRMRAATRQFNQFIEQQMSNSNQLFVDIQQTLDNIHDNQLFSNNK